MIKRGQEETQYYTFLSGNLDTSCALKNITSLLANDVIGVFQEAFGFYPADEENVFMQVDNRDCCIYLPSSIAFTRDRIDDISLEANSMWVKVNESIIVGSIHMPKKVTNRVKRSMLLQELLFPLITVENLPLIVSIDANYGIEEFVNECSKENELFHKSKFQLVKGCRRSNHKIIDGIFIFNDPELTGTIVKQVESEIIENETRNSHDFIKMKISLESFVPESINKKRKQDETIDFTSGIEYDEDEDENVEFIIEE